MLPQLLARQTVYRLRASTRVDDWENVILDWSQASRQKITGCSLEPLPGSEFIFGAVREGQGRDTITTRWSWMGPPSADVLSNDRIEYKGIIYEVDGSVEAPEGLGLDHKHAILKQVQEVV